MAAFTQSGYTVVGSYGSSELDVHASVDGVAFPGGIRAGSVTTVLLYVAGRWNNEVEPLKAGQCWGYAHRDIRGGSGWSNHCLTADTTVVTADGPRKIGELAGTTATILTRSPGRDGNRGRWVDAPVRSFGQDEVWRITLRRGAVEKAIHATADHRWFVDVREPHQRTARKGAEVRTAELTQGMGLSSCLPRHVGRIHPSPFGIVHGIVYGDGTIQPTQNGRGAASKVALWNEKRELLRYFPDGLSQAEVTRDTGAVGVQVHGLPRAYKDRPSLDEAPAYLAGWLAGYIATDGTVTRGTLSISSLRLEDLHLVAQVAQTLGIACNEPRVEHQSGGYKPSDQWVMSFVTASVPDWILIREKHSERLNHTDSRRPWKVQSVERTGRVEDVYCATVEGTGAFTLDGWILTGNSGGCAIDINANDHPQHKYTLSQAKIDAAHRILASVDSAVRWGGDWTPASLDQMHWEIKPGAAGAATDALAGRITSGDLPHVPTTLSGGKPPEHHHPHKPARHTGGKVATVAEITVANVHPRELQVALNVLGASPQLAVDGKIGKATTGAVKWAQKICGVTVDGYVGAKTRHAINGHIPRAWPLSHGQVFGTADHEGWAKRTRSGDPRWDGDGIRHWVRLIQTALHDKFGAPGGSWIDGIYGEPTDRYMRKAQRARDLAVDGLCGRDTFLAIFRI
jgi:hypothetical protein